MPLRSELCGQGSAALSATARNDGTSGAGPHAGAEAVHASATTVIRLEGPLALGHGHHSSNCHALGSVRVSAKDPALRFRMVLTTTPVHGLVKKVEYIAWPHRVCAYAE